MRTVIMYSSGYWWYIAGAAYGELGGFSPPPPNFVYPQKWALKIFSFLLLLLHVFCLKKTMVLFLEGKFWTSLNPHGLAPPPKKKLVLEPRLVCSCRYVSWLIWSMQSCAMWAQTVTRWWMPQSEWQWLTALLWLKFAAAYTTWVFCVM